MQFIVRATPFFLIRVTFTNLMTVSTLKMVVIYKKNYTTLKSKHISIKGIFPMDGYLTCARTWHSKTLWYILILYYFQSRVQYEYLKTNAIVFILYTGYKKLSNDQELSGTEENFQGLFLHF